MTPVSSDANPFRYSGEYFDAESGDYYLRARYYNPRLGRFLTEDPVRDGDNWYVYCSNNPILLIDPLGLAEVIAREFAEGYGATVTWTGNTKSGGKTYANATIEYNGMSINITGALVNDRLVIDDSAFACFGWGMLNASDIVAGVMTKNVNGEIYKDYTVPVDNALGKVVEEAKGERKKQYQPLYDACFYGTATIFEAWGSFFDNTVYKYFDWFYKLVEDYAPWDIKREDSWNGTIADGTYPGSFHTPIYYNGSITTPENLGNYTYGYIGAAAGIPLFALYLGSWYAAGFPTMFAGASYENEVHDQNMVKFGYDSYMKWR